MKKILTGLAVLTVAFQAPSSAKEGIVTGKVVDRTCYLEDHTNIGIGHPNAPATRHFGKPDECARICSQHGLPLALLTADNKLYTVTGVLAARGAVRNIEFKLVKGREDEPNAVLVTHLTHTLVVGGDITEKDGVLEINSTTYDWNMDNKDWRVGSDEITEHSKGDGLKAPRNQPRGQQK